MLFMWTQLLRKHSAIAAGWHRYKRRSTTTAPRDLQDRVQEHTSSRSFDRVQEGGQRLHVTLLTILRSCTGAPPRTVWPSRIKER